MEIFLKNAEKGFADKLGSEKASSYSNSINTSLKEIDKEIQSFMRSEIAKFLFKLSQNLENKSPESLERILMQILRFSHAISNLNGKNQALINQDIIKRSGKKSRGILDLFKMYIEKESDNYEKKTEPSSIEDIINEVYGIEEIYTQFSDIGGFLKRAEKVYADKIGKEKVTAYFDQISKLATQIPQTDRNYMGSDIAKYLLTYSENIQMVESEEIEHILVSTISFLKALTELDYASQAELNKVIFVHSDHKARNLTDLYSVFLNKSRVSILKIKNPIFDDILLHAFGLHSGPKIIEEAPPLHKLMINSHKEFPIAEEHEKWASAIFNAIPRYFEILQNEQGDKILNQLWNKAYPKYQIIEKFQEKINEIPREDEKPFVLLLLNLLTQQILIDPTLDRALTGAVAFIALAKVFTEIFSGKNATIRAIRIRDHLEERKNAPIERKNDLDYNIQKILEEDFRAIQKNSYMLKSIITIISNKEFFIKISDLVEEDDPKDLVDVYATQDALSPIKKHYLNSSLYGEIIIALKFFLKNLDFVKKFYDTCLYDFLSIPEDARKKLENLKEFLIILLDLRDNMEANKFYSQKVEVAEHQIYYATILYLYEPLVDFFKNIDLILQQKTESLKIESLPQFLSNEKMENCLQEIFEIERKIQEGLSEGFTSDSDKIKWLQKSLDYRKTDAIIYQLITNLLTIVNEKITLYITRMKFSQILISFLMELKTIHRTLPAAFSFFVDKIESFDSEIDDFMEQIKKVHELGFILPSQYVNRKKRAHLIKIRLSDLKSNQKFIEQLKILQKMNQKNIIFL